VASSRDEDQRVYYVYGLIDPQAMRDTHDELLSVFYVGKGRGSRAEDHENDVRRALTREAELLERHGSKAARIRKILERGDRVQALILASGFIDSQDAERAESLAIATVNALLAAAQRSQLTNASPGNFAGFLHLSEHLTFVSCDPLVIDPEAGAHLAILVKGTPEPLAAGGHREVQEDLGFDALAERIIVLRDALEPDDGAFTRRGWDPHDPWSDDEARERARRYWPLGREKVLAWLGDPDGMPRLLLLGIPHHGRTVVRYMWSIAPDGAWEYFPDTHRWGVPLGKRILKHSLLGKVLLERRDGREVQVLLNYSSGHRVLKV
jgi:hypothetical protein